MRTALVRVTLPCVVHADSARWLAEAVSPLTSKFGDRLLLFRDGNRVQWSVDGQAAVMELQSGGDISATFFDRPALDVVTSKPAAAIYRSRVAGYSLSPEGCARVVADMVEFFSGTREPRFSFVDATVLEAPHSL
jgi:hypothetical protein